MVRSNLPDIVPGQVKYTVKSEANDRGGPGNAGMIAPTIPVSESSIATNIIITIMKVIVLVLSCAKILFFIRKVVI